MKRGRKPRGSNICILDKEVEEFEEPKNQNSGRSIMDLPSPISVDILLRLSTKKLLICKCVCKTWRGLILDPEFAKRHFARAEAYPLIRALSSTHICRTLYFFEPPEQNSRIGLWKCLKKIEMKLDTKLKIPLHNAELVINSEVGVNVNLNSKGGVKRKRCINLRPNDHKFNVVNSCNGLLCLSETIWNDPIVVCNPITGEYINLPATSLADMRTRMINDGGLDFSPKTNQYKVIRMFRQETCELMRDLITGKEIFSQLVAEVHALGTGSWKRIGLAPFSTYGYKLAFPTYLNGSLHWLRFDYEMSNYIISFNFNEEKFQSVPPPLLKNGMMSFGKMHKMSLGLLRDQLCICDCSGLGNIKVWMMTEYGVQRSWRKVFRIRMTTHDGIWLRGLYEPISYLRVRGILLFHRKSNAVFYYDPKKREFKFLKLHGFAMKFEAIPHIPSFISLKDAVLGDNVEVLNIASRCAEFNLEEETEALYIANDIPDMNFDFNPSSSDTD